MRQIITNIYKFDELSEQSKENALNNFSNVQEIAWGEEWMQSLKTFCNLFDIELCDWQYGSDGVMIKTNIEYLDYGIDYTIDEKWFEKHDLSKSCPFTGYIGDESLLDPLKEIQETGSIRRVDALQACLDKWKEDFQKDIEHQFSDEYQIEHIEANDYEFTEKGDLFND